MKSLLKEASSDDRALEFAPGLLQIQDAPPSPLPRLVLRGLLILLGALMLWAMFGRLDIVAIAEGKLVPISYLKIVQPAESGIVREIAVREGQQVHEGQILLRMDTNISEADSKAIQASMQHKSIELRRIEAELNGTSFTLRKGDPTELFNRIQAEYSSNIRAFEDSLATEQTSLQKARHDLAATIEVQHKLEETLPTYRAQEEAFDKLGKVGFAGNLMVMDKKRERIEKEQDLNAQRYNVQSLQSTIAQSERRLAQIRSSYRQKLEVERVGTYAEYQRLEQEWAKQSHRNSLQILKAPQAGIIKDLATHTPGTVVSPGTVLMTLVPNNEALQAEVWIKNSDSGFVYKGQQVKVKLSAYPFQKYGMLDGEVVQVGADASDKGSQQQGSTNVNSEINASHLSYRALVELKQQAIIVEDDQMKLSPGMQVTAEIKLSDQTVLEYLLSPVRKAFHEAGRER